MNPIDRAARIERARYLHARHYTIRQIAERIGTTRTTARRYVDPGFDAFMKKSEKERKKRYSGACMDCGKPTSYAGKPNGRRSSLRCRNCAAKSRKRWTREAIIDAIQQWNAEYGRPPSSLDWNKTVARQVRGSEYPASTSVYGDRGAFANWGDAIEAAGFPRPKKTYKGGFGEMYWTKERVIEALRAYSTNGVAPPQKEWRRSGEDHPTTSWVARLFGSWTDACHAAGLVTYREVYWHGPPTDKKRLYRDIDAILDELVPVDPTQREKERLDFVRRVMDDHVLRRFVLNQLWKMWGFKNRDQMATWLNKNDIREFPGHSYRPHRQLTREELTEAESLKLPPAVAKTAP